MLRVESRLQCCPALPYWHIGHCRRPRKAEDSGMHKRFVLVLAPLLFIVGALLLVFALSMEVFTATRAFVAAEAQWARAQRDAVYHLQAFARSRDDADYRAFREAMAVPLALRKARMALQSSTPDYETARRGFIEAGNHTGDVEAMVRFLSVVGGLPRVARTMAAWETADRHLAELEALATGGRLGELGAVRIGVANAEAELAAVLGDATRRVKSVLVWSLLAAAVALVALALLVGRRNLTRAAAAEEAVRESEARMRLVA